MNEIKQKAASASSGEIAERVDAILGSADLPDRHSYFQMEKFMIGKEPTGQAQLWAIVRELRSRRETVECYRRDLADAEDNLELFDVRIERLNREIREKSAENNAYADLDIVEREIAIRKLQREKESLAAAAAKVADKLGCVRE